MLTGGGGVGACWQRRHVRGRVGVISCAPEAGQCKMYKQTENELRLGFSNTTRNPEGILSHNNRKVHVTTTDPCVVHAPLTATGRPACSEAQSWAPHPPSPTPPPSPFHHPPSPSLHPKPPVSFPLPPPSSPAPARALPRKACLPADNSINVEWVPLNRCPSLPAPRKLIGFLPHGFPLAHIKKEPQPLSISPHHAPRSLVGGGSSHDNGLWGVLWPQGGEKGVHCGGAGGWLVGPGGSRGCRACSGRGRNRGRRVGK
jgi:hypothetical protein